MKERERLTKLIERVRTARATYESKQDEVAEARAAYYSAVSTLHQAGMPLREVAEELGLSHQRVHQMVSEAPTTLGRRIRKAAKAGGLGLLIAVLSIGVSGLLSLDKPLPIESAAPTASEDAAESDQQSPTVGSGHGRFEVEVCDKNASCFKPPTRLAKTRAGGYRHLELTVLTASSVMQCSVGAGRGALAAHVASASCDRRGG